MAKHGGNGGKGKNNTLKLRQGKIMSYEGKGTGKISLRHNRHQCEGKAHVKDDNLSVKNDVDSMRVTQQLSPMQKIIKSETFTFCVINMKRFQIMEGMEFV